MWILLVLFHKYLALVKTLENCGKASVWQCVALNLYLLANSTTCCSQINRIWLIDFAWQHCGRSNSVWLRFSFWRFRCQILIDLIAIWLKFKPDIEILCAPWIFALALCSRCLNSKQFKMRSFSGAEQRRSEDWMDILIQLNGAGLKDHSARKRMA